MSIVAKYLGSDPQDQYYNGIPARDLDEADFEGLSDEQKAMLAATPPEGVKPLYRLMQGASKEAASAERRVERATAADEAPAAEGKK